MRNDTRRAKREEVKQLLSLFAYRFGELSRVIREYREQHGVIPKASAFEVQHMFMHIAAIFHNAKDNDMQYRHASAACGHLDRALLDAYKSLFFRVKKPISRHLEYRQRLAQCRKQEFDDGCMMEYTRVLGRYRLLFKQFGSEIAEAYPYDETFFPKHVKVDLRDKKLFYEELVTWLQQDLLLSAVAPNYSKDLVLLRGLIELLLNGKGPCGESPLNWLHELTFQQRCLIVRYSLDFEDGEPFRRFADAQRKVQQFKNALEALAAIRDNSEAVPTHKHRLEKIYPVAVSFWQSSAVHPEHSSA